MSRHPPGILRVKSEPLHVLRETSVAGRHRRASNSRRRIRLCSAASAEEKFGRIRGVKAGVVRISQHGFRRSRKRAAQYRLMNKIYAEAWSVSARRVTGVVAQLVFFLVAQHRKRSDRCRK